MRALHYLLIGALIGALALIIILNLPALRGAGKNVDLSRPAVVEQMHKLSRLETASFTIEKVIEAGTYGGAFSDFLFGDRILLVAHGEVVAGFDLSQLTEKDIDVKGADLTIRMPAPQILYARLDNEKTKVFDRKRGLLVKGDKDLESEARAAAEASIVAAACEGGILDRATENMRETLATLFTALGFKNVNIITQSATCGA